MGIIEMEMKVIHLHRSQAASAGRNYMRYLSNLFHYGRNMD